MCMYMYTCACACAHSHVLTHSQVSALLKARAAGPYDTLKQYHIPSPVPYQSPERTAAEWAGGRFAHGAAGSPYEYHRSPSTPY